MSERPEANPRPSPPAKLRHLLGGPAVFVVLLLTPLDGLPFETRGAMGLLIWMAWWWITRPVHLAVTGFLDFEPDLVVSGINHGANLGDDVIYSGTVAAAMEGRFLGLPTIAVSLVGNELQHFETAAAVASELVQKIERAPLASDVVLNLNVPDVVLSELKGVQATRLGFRHKSEQLLTDTDPYGRPIYWVGPAGEGQDAGEGTDFFAVRQGFASVTPLKVDLTRYTAIDDLSDWLGTT